MSIFPQRYCRGTFTKSYKKTIGVDFLEKQLRVQSEEVTFLNKNSRNSKFIYLAQFRESQILYLTQFRGNQNPYLVQILESQNLCLAKFRERQIPYLAQGAPDAVGHGRPGGVRRPHQVLLQGRSGGAFDYIDITVVL